MSTTQIQVTAADNELILIASTSAGSSTLLHYKSGYSQPVNVTLYPPAILAPGTYSLTMIGVNWGGPANFTVVVTSNGQPTTYQSQPSQNVGVTWNQTITITI